MRLFLLYFSALLCLYTVPAAGQSCGSLDLADPARVECRLAKAADDQRTADLASSRARAEIDKAISDFRAYVDLAPAHDPAPPSTDWPDVAARCEHAGGTVVQTGPQTELAPFGPWRVATADCGADITARFYTDGDQIRVAFEYQKPDLFSDAPARTYTGIVTLDGVEVARHAVTHYPYQRWSWRRHEPRVIRTPAELFAAGLALPVAPVAQQNANVARIQGVYEPLGFAGFQPRMEAAGGRQDFGITTEAQGCYLATLQAWCATIMWDQADSLGTWQLNARDPATGAPLRFDGAFIRDSFLDTRFGVRKIVAPRVPHPTQPDRTTALEQAHFPSFSYIPWLLTGDPYYLEGLQFELVYIIGASNNIGNAAFARAVFNGQPRAVAWSVKEIVQAALGTPETVPDWLVDRAYYRWLSAGNADYVRRLYAQGEYQIDLFPKPLSAPFDMFTGTLWNKNTAATVEHRRWMADFMGLSIGLALHGGLDEWKPVADWFFPAAVNCARWMRGLCPTYKIPAAKPDGTVVQNWAEFAALWAGSISEHTLHGTAPNVAEDYKFYAQYYHATVKMAAHFGYADADKVAAWMQSQRLRHNPALEYRFEVQFAPPPDVAAGVPLIEFLEKPE